MKLLFLDIDGVLNSSRTDRVYGSDKTIENLDPIAVGLIYNVVNSVGCIICLSSNWRFDHDYMELGKELHLPIMFETGKQLEIRGDEIQEILDAVKPEKYAIIDDVGNPQEGMLESQKDNFVKVDGDEGVSYKNYLDLVDILK